MWHIMSYNALRGCIAGVFQTLDDVFIVGEHQNENGDGFEIEWTPVLSRAKSFDTIDAAKEYADRIWGKTMKDSFLFVYANGDGIVRQIDDDWAMRELNRRQRVTDRLSSGGITREELIEKAKDCGDPQDVGLTWREKKIIDLMAKEA